MSKKTFTRVVIPLIFCSVLMVPGWGDVGIAREVPPRKKTITIEYLEHTWWLVEKKNNRAVCELLLEGEGIPSGEDIYQQCGLDKYNEWLAAGFCIEEEDEGECVEYYFQLIQSLTREKEMEIDLPPAQVKIAGFDQEPVSNTSLFQEIPKLVITAEEPLPNESIEHIQGKIGREPFQCSGSRCEIYLSETDRNGILITFQAKSSYGDFSEEYQARVRVIRNAFSGEEEKENWYVELLSADQNQTMYTGCAAIWGVFPPPGTQPNWLRRETNPRYLKTAEPFAYLAGQLIKTGEVDVSVCEDGGLLENGYASPCGLDAARFEVDLWQNVFDPLIVKNGQETGVPSVLIKRILALESQFWPETTKSHYREYGLGQINELGADTLLYWNDDFYRQFCPLVLEQEYCSRNYASLKDEQKVLLRGALLSEIAIDFKDDTISLNEARVDHSISVFTEALLANCTQVGVMIQEETGELAVETTRYEDLWRFTLVNYHGGSGCFLTALEAVVMKEEPVDWDQISQALENICPHAIEYVDSISR